MAGKTPGPRRLDEDEVGKFDAKVVVIQEDALDGCIRKANQAEGLMPQVAQEDVHLNSSPKTMLKDLAIDDQVVDVDRDVDLSWMMPSTKMKRSMSHVVDGMQAPGIVGALLPCENKPVMGSSEFVRGEFVSQSFSEVLVVSRCCC